MRVILLTILSLFTSGSTFAQCVMCKGTTEGAYQQGNDAVMGLNGGILYLFLAPYVILSVILFFWYRNNKKSRLKDI